MALPGPTPAAPATASPTASTTVLLTAAAGEPPARDTPTTAFVRGSGVVEGVGAEVREGVLSGVPVIVAVVEGVTPGARLVGGVGGVTAWW